MIIKIGELVKSILVIEHKRVTLLSELIMVIMSAFGDRLFSANPLDIIYCPKQAFIINQQLMRLKNMGTIQVLKHNWKPLIV